MKSRTKKPGARTHGPHKEGISTRRRPVAGEEASAFAGSPRPKPDVAWPVPVELGGKHLDAVVRGLSGRSWSEARELVATGKIAIGGETEVHPLRAMTPGEVIELRVCAPRPRTAKLARLSQTMIVYVDVHVVVVRKPAGISTVPFGDEASEQRAETLDELVRDVLGRQGGIGRDRGAPLGVVQRLDKETSGLLVFARTFAAKKHLGQQLRLHTMHRRYLGIAHGDVPRQVFRTHLVADRGDHLRGSAEAGRREGQLAVTHVEPLERLNGATLIACRLETGRTHQIRIHLSESGHPLVGERVYIRDYRGQRLDAPRILLHAAELGFAHPADERPMRFDDPLPEDFEQVLARLRQT